MLLAIDIGNTNIVIGIFKGKRIHKRLRLKTESTCLDIKRRLKGAVGFKKKAFEAVIISSVVPGLSKKITGIVRDLLKIEPLLLGKDIRVPIKNLYKNPKQVGQDRLVNSYACLKLYGTPAIIIDFGTATTFDYIDSNGAYAGGLITPGVEATIDALANRAALLPRIKLDKPKALLGKDTAESIRSGIVYGLTSMCNGIVDKLKKRYKKRPIVVATGGLAGFFAPHCKDIDRIDKDLTLKGLSLLIRL
ncbi:MAG: type III pantothenate kinase [Candidatus Omnitrophica bacterium]|nr:type III pantothenate kinase [Candidatus Omnitrophota bacterium]